MKGTRHLPLPLTHHEPVDDLLHGGPLGRVDIQALPDQVHSHLGRFLGYFDVTNLPPHWKLTRAQLPQHCEARRQGAVKDQGATTTKRLRQISYEQVQSPLTTPPGTSTRATHMHAAQAEQAHTQAVGIDVCLCCALEANELLGGGPVEGATIACDVGMVEDLGPSDVCTAEVGQQRQGR